MDDISWAPGERGWLGAIAALLVGAMLYPLRQHLRPVEDQVDGFPLSYYPMFRTLRKQTVRIVYAVGVDANEQRCYLPHAILGAGGFNQARHQLNRAAKEKRTQEYATALASRIASNPTYADLVRVDILRGTFDLDACLLNGRVSSDRDKPLASTPVVRTARTVTTTTGSEV